MSLRALGLAALCVIAGSAPAFADYIVDGDLSDWGVLVADNNATTFITGPNSGLLGTHLEDQDDNAGDGAYVGPLYGGQNYDAEYMGVARQGSEIFISIMTGQRPDNGLTRFAPGDILIETDTAIYGIEVGGGEGGVAGALVGLGEIGSTYELNGSGYTIAHEAADAQQTTGSIWVDVNWSPTQFEIDSGSTLVGMASDYVYTSNTSTSQHAVVELSFDTSLLAGQTITSIQWRPSCGNDELIVAVPEPASLALLLVGGLTLVNRKRR